MFRSRFGDSTSSSDESENWSLGSVPPNFWAQCTTTQIGGIQVILVRMHWAWSKPFQWINDVLGLAWCQVRFCNSRQYKENRAFALFSLYCFTCFAAQRVYLGFIIVLFHIISWVSPLGVTWLRTLRLIMESKNWKKKNGQHPVGFEPVAFQFSDWQAGTLTAMPQTTPIPSLL